MVDDKSSKSKEKKVESKEEGVDLPSFIKEKQKSIVELSPISSDGVLDDNASAVLDTVVGVAKEYDVSNQYLVDLIYGKNKVDLENFPGYSA